MIQLHLLQVLKALEGIDNEEFNPMKNSLTAIGVFFAKNPRQLKKAEMLREMTEEELKKYLENC
jgi:hypothetical protein